MSFGAKLPVAIDVVVGYTYDEPEITVATGRIKRTAACSPVGGAARHGSRDGRRRATPYTT